MDTKDTCGSADEIFFRPHRTYRCNADGETGMDETFYMNEDLPSSTLGNILHCFAFGISRWGSNWSINKEYGQYISFNFFLAGGVIIQTRESTMEVRSGDLLIARRSPLVMRTPPGGMAQKYCLLLSNTMIQSAICDLWGHNDPCVLHPAEPEKIGSALEKIAEYVKKGDSRKQLELLIFAFLQEVCRQHRQREKIPELLEKAQSILKKEDYRLSRAELADRCQVSPRTLTRIFARCLNCSPGQYIIKCRLEKAARMLSFSSAPVKTIAAECGFSSPMFFAREFRQHYHCTPTAFRRRENKK